MHNSLAAEDYIRLLKLEPHIEGGYYREVYRSRHEFPVSVSDPGDKELRNLATTIYFLLRSGETSRFHVLKSDEIWFYHAGGPLTLYQIYPGGDLVKSIMGNDVSAGMVPQLVIPAGVIFGAEVNDPESFTLVSCMVAPGFDYRDFRLCATKELMEQFPGYSDLIGRINKM